MNTENKKNRYYYRLKDRIEDCAICQYMRLDYLIQLLETRNYYVKRRKHFVDANESYQNNKLAFGPIIVGEHNPVQQISIERIIPYSKIIECPTSCWSMAEEENYLMWKSYATEVGACVRTNVHNVIASLHVELDKDSENKIVCGSMDYKKYRPSSIEENQLFDKDHAYADEKEFRFYFYFPDYNNEDKEKRAIYIPVDTEVMIDEIILSPFMPNEAADKLVRMIKCAYNINVRQSRIRLK